MNLLVTGGCGFIGSNFIERVINKKQIYKLQTKQHLFVDNL